MQKKIFLPFVAFALILLWSSPALAGGTLPEKNTEAHNSFTFEGTVVHQELEGGFFAIQTDDGKTYVPMNLTKEYQKDGLQVRIEAILRKDIGGIHMVGDTIEIIKIEKK